MPHPDAAQRTPSLSPLSKRRLHPEKHNRPQVLWAPFCRTPMGTPLLGSWVSQRWNKQPPTLSTPGLHPAPMPSGWQALGEQGTTVGTCQTLGMTEPEESSPSLQPPGQVIMAIDKEPGQLFELAGLKVTAKIRCRGQSQGHHSHLDSCTDLGKTASAPSSQGQCLSSTFGGLAGGGAAGS